MKKHLKQLDLKRIRITDSLFGEYVNKVSEKIIPHQWKILNDQLEDSEPTYCIHNFRIAAGEEKGERKGVVFQDTDLYKWLEAVAYTIAGGRGEHLEELADQVIDLIGKAQEPDGYLNTYFSVNAPAKKWTNLVEGHELYTAGHMIEAAVAYYQATGKEKILNIAKKNADLICRVFGTGKGQKRGYPGHQEIELALVKLYRETGKKIYLQQARYFIQERGRNPNYLQAEIAGRGHPEFFPEFERYDLEYSQAHKPPVEQDEAVGHAVREMYMCSAMADLAGEDALELLEGQVVDCHVLGDDGTHAHDGDLVIDEVLDLIGLELGLGEDIGITDGDGAGGDSGQALARTVTRAGDGDIGVGVHELLGSGLVRDEPRVRQNADGAARGVNAVVDAPRCVVRRLKRRDARRADGERREPLHLAEHRPDPRDAPGELARGGGGGVDGNPVALDERLQAGDVVAVLMGDEDGIDLRESNAELLERGLDAPGGDARVHEDARALRVDDQAVPLGAAGQSMYCNHVAVPSKMRVTKTKPAPAVSGRRWNFF